MSVYPFEVVGTVTNGYDRELLLTYLYVCSEEYNEEYFEDVISLEELSVELSKVKERIIKAWELDEDNGTVDKIVTTEGYLVGVKSWNFINCTNNGLTVQIELETGVVVEVEFTEDPGLFDRYVYTGSTESIGVVINNKQLIHILHGWNSNK